MKSLPFNLQDMQGIITRYPTPFHVYDQNGMSATAKGLYEAFKWAPGYTNFFAVKALPNPVILQVLKASGMGVDCSSLAELVLAERAGFSGKQIMFTSNDTTAEEYQKAVELKAYINLDDISHIQFLRDAVGALPNRICFRYNPGNERIGNEIIGNPVEAKYGLTRDQLLQAYSQSRDSGITSFGLHTMVASNELDPAYFIETAQMLFHLAVEIKAALGIELDFINLGGGFGIPYLPDQSPLNITQVATGVQDVYHTILGPAGLTPRLFTECGRYVTGPHGYLISTVIHKKHTYRDYIGLDASMANLMRPGMYGAYHHITVLGKEEQFHTHTYDVTGSLCENNDKFAIQRSLPDIQIGDLLVIHDTGAHGHAMGFNYNGKLRSAELLLHADGTVQLIRRAETLDDYFATLQQ